VRVTDRLVFENAERDPDQAREAAQQAQVAHLNAQFGNRYVVGGFQDGAAPFDPAAGHNHL
jgi:hypothetical protein